MSSYNPPRSDVCRGALGVPMMLDLQPMAQAPGGPAAPRAPAQLPGPGFNPAEARAFRCSNLQGASHRSVGHRDRTGRHSAVWRSGRVRRCRVALW